MANFCPISLHRSTEWVKLLTLGMQQDVTKYYKDQQIGSKPRSQLMLQISNVVCICCFLTSENAMNSSRLLRSLLAAAILTVAPSVLRFAAPPRTKTRTVYYKALTKINIRVSPEAGESESEKINGEMAVDVCLKTGY